MTDFLGSAYPGIADRIPKLRIAALPTPVSRHDVSVGGAPRTVFVKHDNRTSDLYGGNKVRKLEYILRRAIDRGAQRVVTFGAAGSNHALATSTHAHELGLACTCFLGHQRATPNVRKTLTRHLELGTELVHYRGRTGHLELFRKYIQGRKAWVVPVGGSCWYGSLGFVNAGLEIAQQIKDGEIEVPARIYVANGTMGTSSGLALGLALVGLPIEIHAVRVTTISTTHPDAFTRLMKKTALLMHRADPTVPENLVSQTRVVWRDSFLAGGYAAVDEATQQAVGFAADNLGVTLETTYTGKAMAALIQDAATHDAPCLLWNTYCPLPERTSESAPERTLPREFERYFN